MWSRELKSLARDSRRFSPGAEPGGRALQLVPVHDPVRQAVLDRLRGGEVAVPLHVLVDLRDGATRVVRVDLVDPLPLGDHFAGVDVDVGRLALEPARWLVDEDL